MAVTIHNKLRTAIDQLVYARQREWCGWYAPDKLKLRDLIVETVLAELPGAEDYEIEKGTWKAALDVAEQQRDELREDADALEEQKTEWQDLANRVMKERDELRLLARDLLDAPVYWIGGADQTIGERLEKHGIKSAAQEAKEQRDELQGWHDAWKAGIEPTVAKMLDERGEMKQKLRESERQRDELVAELRKIQCSKHRPDCGMLPEHWNVAPGGHECSCPEQWAAAALKCAKEES